MALLGKVLLLTGATEGIGKLAATRFAERGATLVIVGRNPEKSERVRRELEAAGQGRPVELLIGDLSVLADVRAVAASFLAKHQQLHVLVNNAGAIFDHHELTPDGFEKTFALNHLGYFLLTRELLPVLEKTPGARVISTASRAHRRGKIELETIAKRPDGRAGYRAYGDSKLANILFTRELARRTKVPVSCFHPGFVQTGFGLNNRGVFGLVIKIAAAIAGRTPEQGADTLVWLATTPTPAPTGEYFADRKPGWRTRLAEDDAMARSLWELSERLVSARA